MGDRVALFFFSSRRRHTILTCDWSSDVCSSDLVRQRFLWRSCPADAIRNVVELRRIRGRKLRQNGRSEERRVGKESRCRWWPSTSQINECAYKDPRQKMSYIL